ncbi:hypothetical protein AAVH_43263, partial [Aphelenchoides avenae]
ADSLEKSLSRNCYIWKAYDEELYHVATAFLAKMRKQVGLSAGGIIIITHSLLFT